MSHLAIPQVARRNLDRALELALAPLSSTAPFSDVDKSLLHNGVALCHWAREESHHAISHLIREFDLIRNANDFDRTSVVLGNMGVVLLVLGEWELALSISGKAWHLQLANCVDNKKLQVSQLVNIMLLNCLLGKYEAALVHGEWLYGRLSETREPSTWPHFLNLANAFSLNGRTKEARGCLGRARELNASIQTEFSIANLKAADATFHEAQKDFSSAIRLSKEVLDQPVHIVKRAAHLWSALVVSRSYRKLGRGKESNKWQEIANEIRHERPLGEIFASQIQASLRIEPLGDPLTEKEMACLVLSTRGQTSADIGLKLGITTRTVNFHFAKILRKLNASNRQEAIAKAVSANLLHASL